MRCNFTSEPYPDLRWLWTGLCSFLLIFCLTQNLYAQESTVTGTVTSAEDGAVLPGVNVIVKGSTIGTVTDIEGNYRLNVPNDANTLTFSFIGLLEQEIDINGRSEINVVMQSDVQQLTEVVVTAIGIEREKKALGYSVASVDGERIAQRSEPDPIRSLSGKMPGVNIQAGGGAPGQSTKINIRGISSLTGNTQPLFVVDGIPFDNSTNSINPTDPSASVGVDNSAFSNRAFDIDPNNIESLTVLKGAAAAALYGSRATNGVVVITTKSAKKNAKKGLEVTYNGSYNVENVSSLPEYQDIYAQGSNQLYNAGFIGNWGAPFPDHVDRLNALYGTNYSKTMYGGVTDAEGNVIVPATPEGYIQHPLIETSYGQSQGYHLVFPELVKGYYIADEGVFITDRNDPRWGTGTPIGIDVPFQPYDIVGGFFDQGRVIENSVNITSGSETTTLSGGVSRMDNTGIIPNSEASRTSLNFGGNGQLSNGLFISGNVNYVNTTQQTPQSGGSFFLDYTTATSTSLFGRLFYLPRNFNLNGYPFENPVDGSNVFYRALDNPLWIAKYNSYSSDVNRVFGNMSLSYDIGEWLNITAKGGVNTYSEARKDIVRSGGTAIPAGRVWTEDLTYTEQDYNVIATVTKDFTDAIGFRAIVGGNVNQRELSRRKVTGSGIISEGLYNVDATTQTTVNYDFRSLRRFYAAYADLQFSYNDYFFLNVVGRNDWSSTLPVDNRSYFYPGVSASLIFTEAFGISNNILNYGKVRGAITKVGNEPNPYLTATYFNIIQPFTGANGVDYNGATLGDVLGNANLKPEFTTEIEAGVELQLLDNRVGLDLTYFKRTSTDQIATARIPATSGFEREVVNIGELENKGWEIGLDLTPLRLNNGFSWNIYTAFTRIRSLVVDAGPAGEIYIGGPLTTLGTIHRSGEPYGQILGSKNARDEEGNLLINKASGLPFRVPTSEIIGDPNPDFIMGITNTFTYKGFTLRALVDWRQGGDIYSATAASLLLRGQLKLSEDREGLRVVPGVYGDPQTYEPVLDENGNKIVNTTPITAFDYHFTDGFGAYGQDEVNVYDGTTIRLREVSLGYALPQSIIEKTPFGSVKVMLSGRNLWFKAPNFLEGLNFDPEVLAEPADSNVQGFDYGATPSTRRYGVNLSLTF